jgi:hypothetical protein
VPISSPPVDSAAAISRSHRSSLPSPPPSPALSRERRGTKGRFGLSFVTKGCYPRPRASVSESRSKEGFRGEIGSGTTPSGFNRTCYKFGPGLNLGELDTGCQTGIRAQSRPDWDETNKALLEKG